MRRSKRLWVAAAALPLFALGQWMVPTASASSSSSDGPLSAAEAGALSTNVNQKVIVVLKDQVPQYPADNTYANARSQVEAQEQSPLVSELNQTNARSVHSYTVINAMAATVSSGEESLLASNPAVAEVVPDQIIQLANTLDAPSTPNTTATSNTAGGITPLPGTCSSNPNNPQLAPQALSLIGADSQNPNQPTARSLGITGAGVKVAFIADAVDTSDLDFIRPNGQPVFTNEVDFSGEGTAVPTGGGEGFLDASSIAAQGREVYNISNYSALALNRPCYIRIEGVAPGASLVGLDIFGAEDAGYNSSFLEAIDYAVSKAHVQVLNESLGSNPYPDDQASLDLIKQANDEAVAAGVTVTASSGDAGVTNTIGSPSTDPNVISAGASTSYETPSQLGYAGFQFPGLTGYLNNNISSLSSSGFEQDGATISLVAPGELNWALCSTDNAQFSDCTNYQGNPTPIEESGGTSEAAPLTAGAAALVIQAYAKTHGGALPTPALVKQILTSTADDIQAPADEQGSGLLDAYRAVVAAESYHAPAPAQTPDTLLESTPQFNAVAAGGTPETLTEQLTNLGSTPDTVNVSSRTLGAYRPIYSTTVTLSDTTSPHSVDYQGINDNYEVVHFYVAPGADRLNGSIAFQGASSALPARVRMNLIDPQGQLADYSLPQGVGNYGDAQVASPEPGMWTAYIWSRDTADGGTTGPVVFGASVASYQSFGTVSPATLTIAPGATAPVTLSVQTPRTPGDTAGSLVLSSPWQAALAIPVTLRSLVPSGPTNFSGVLTGGNGRTAVTGETEYYQLDVAPRTPELNASVTLANNPNNQTFAWLIDPSGQAQAYQSNTLVTEDSSGAFAGSSTLGTNLHVLNPAPGRWTLIILYGPTVSGVALSEPYSVSVNEFPVPVNAFGVPQGNPINAAHPATVYIRVTNTGSAPESYFVDGRTNAQASYSLPAYTAAQTTVPLNFEENLPVYIVPSETSAIQATASTTGTEPIQFDLGAPSGDPDVASGQGLNVAATASGNPLSGGAWDIAPTTVGPFGTTGAAQETVNTTLTAVTQGFDPAVTSATGDLWQSALGGPVTAAPDVVQPGQSVTIAVQIAPTGAAGTVVSGHLYLDDDSLLYYGGGLVPNANTVAAIPYSYRIAP